MSTYSRNACLAWLASVGLTPSETEALLRENPDPVSLYREWTGGKRPEAAQGLSGKLQEMLTHNSAAKWMDAWENVMRKCEIQAVTFQDAAYPDRLRPLGDAPAVLFYQGNLSAVSGDEGIHHLVHIAASQIMSLQLIDIHIKPRLVGLDERQDNLGGRHPAHAHAHHGDDAHPHICRHSGNPQSDRHEVQENRCKNQHNQKQDART